MIVIFWCRLHGSPPRWKKSGLKRLVWTFSKAGCWRSCVILMVRVRPSSSRPQRTRWVAPLALQSAGITQTPSQQHILSLLLPQHFVIVKFHVHLGFVSTLISDATPTHSPTDQPRPRISNLQKSLIPSQRESRSLVFSFNIYREPCPCI